MADIAIIKRNQTSGDKEVNLEIDPIGGSPTGDDIFSVSGKITDAFGQPVENTFVAAYDIKILGEVLLGDNNTSATGDFLIYYNRSQISDGKLCADLQVRVHETDTSGEVLAQSSVIDQAGKNERVFLAIAPDGYLGQSEYAIMLEKLTPFIGGIDLSMVAPDRPAILAAKIDEEEEVVMDFLQARILAGKTTVSEEALYGLMRYQLPYTFTELLKTPDDDKRRALIATTNANIINPAIADDIEAIIIALRASLVDNELDLANPNGNFLVQLLTLAGLDETKQKAFYTAYLNDGSVGSDFWIDITNNGTLSVSERETVKKLFQYSVITQNHLPLITLLHNDANLSTLQDVSALAIADWSALVDQTGVPNVPAAQLTPEVKSDYVDALITASEEAYPSVVLRKFLEIDADPADLDTLTFLQDNPDFDFKDTSPTKFIAENPNAIDNINSTDKIFETKRLWHVAEGFNKAETIKALSSSGFDSASKIGAYGERKFIKDLSTFLGGAEQAKNIYKKAVKRTAAAVMLHGSHNESIDSISTNVFKTSSVSESDAAANPELQALFGSLDFCDCTHCRSSLSPAAYLVDVLAFLKDAENTKAGQLPAWDQLKLRRPELEKIELSCKNTNTTLPYTDIVNEVLEYAVAGSGNIMRQTTGDTELLKAEPEHINVTAYETLKTAESPWLLPFHLWNEEGSIYLKQLGINRGDIIRSLAPIGDAVVDTLPANQREAMVGLDISTEMFDVLVNTTKFAPYYGNSNSINLRNVSLLLAESNLEYEELLGLLESDFINPMNKVIEFIPENSCSISDAMLVFDSPDNIELKRLHRFKRLMDVLEWSMAELDIAISILPSTEIDAQFITDLYYIEKIRKGTRLSVLEALSWFGELSNKSYAKTASHYASIFLNPILFGDNNITPSGDTIKDRFENIDTVPVELLANGTIHPENGPIVLSATNLNTQDLLLIIEKELVSGTVNRAQLSHIYRIASFVKAKKLSVEEYIILREIIPLNPLEANSPEDVLSYSEKLVCLSQAKLSVAELNYLFRHVETPALTSLSDTKLAAYLTNLRTLLQSKLLDAGIGNTVSKEGLLNAFLMFFDEPVAVKSLEVVEDLPNSIIDANDFIDANWTGLFEDLQAVKDVLIGGAALPTIDERYNEIFRLLYPQVATSLVFNDEVTQSMADFFGSTIDVIRELSTNQLTNPADINKSALTLFTQFGFVFSSDDITRIAPFDNHFVTLITIGKINIVSNKLQIGSDDLDFVLNNNATTGWFDLRSFPTNFPIDPVPLEEIDALLKLSKAYDLESRYANANGFSIIKLIHDAETTTVPLSIRERLSQGTSWNIDDIEYLIGNAEFDISIFTNQDWIEKLDAVHQNLIPLGVNAAQLIDWVNVNLTAENAQAIISSVKAQFSLASWYPIASDLRDELRMKQRDALSAYLISINDDFKNTNDLYAYYLLDTEVNPCFLTSRIKLAISTAQLWVQRIRMNLETSISFTKEDLDEWNWRKNYRVWEAARKVFLYPENWVQPELRDDKTEFFIEMEDELLQDEITEETAEKAYLNYLNKLDDVANLEISGTFKDEDRNILHVFARTKNTPHLYHHRTLEDGFQWTSWKRLELDIEAEHLIPTVFNRRPMLFWPIMNEKPVKVSNEDLNVKVTNGQIAEGDDVQNKVPLTKIEIQMAYSEFKNNRWQPKKISNSRLISENGVSPQNYFFKTEINDDGLSIDTFYQDTETNIYAHVGKFLLNNCTAEIEVRRESTAASPSAFSITNTIRNYMKIAQKDGDIFELTEKVRVSPDDFGIEFNEITKAFLLARNTVNVDKNLILGRTPNKFKITYPITGTDILADSSFFYEDGSRTFFVTPEDEVFEKEVLLKLKPIFFFPRLLNPISEDIPISLLEEEVTDNIASSGGSTTQVPPDNVGTGGAVSTGGSGGGSTGGLDGLSRGEFRRLATK